MSQMRRALANLVINELFPLHFSNEIEIAAIVKMYAHLS